MFQIGWNLVMKHSGRIWYQTTENGTKLKARHQNSRVNHYLHKTNKKSKQAE